MNRNDGLCPRCALRPKVNAKKGYCTECVKDMASGYREKYRNRIYEKQREVFRSNSARISKIKTDSGCADCVKDGRDPHWDAVALDFDHVRGEKKLTISHSLNYCWATLQEEIDKCDVVCANHHRVRTHRSDRPRVGFMAGMISNKD